MSQDREFLDFISRVICSKGPHKLEYVINSRKYAKIGDALVNLAATISSETFDTSATIRSRVDNRFLKQVARFSKLNDFLRARMSTHEIGNAVEALLAFGWLSGYVTLGDIVMSLSDTDKEVIKMVQLIDRILEVVDKNFEVKK